MTAAALKMAAPAAWRYRGRAWTLAAVLFLITMVPSTLPHYPTILFGSVVLGLAFCACENKGRLPFSLFPAFLLLFALCVFISEVWCMLSGGTFSFVDLSEMLRAFCYAGLFMLFSAGCREEKDRERVTRGLIGLLSVSSFVAVTQFFNPFHLNERYVPYIAPTQYLSLINNHSKPRVVGLTPNPNVFAFLAAVAVGLSFLMLLRSRRLRYAALILLNGIALLMSSSRSAFIMLIFLVVFFAVFYCWVNFGIIDALLFCGVLVAVGTVLLMLLPQSITGRILEVFQFGSVKSMQERYIHWQESFRYIHQSPLLGIGPGTAVDFQYAADNEWLLLMRQYGAVGVLVWTSAMVLPVINGVGRRFRDDYFMMAACLMAGSFVCMYVSAFYHNNDIGPVVMVILALGIGAPFVKTAPQYRSVSGLLLGKWTL